MVSAETPDILAEDFPDFCRSLQANSSVGLRSGFDHFRPNNIQFIICRPVIRRYIICILKMSLNNQQREVRTKHGIRKEQVSI
jgi:hypothetical protein